MDNNETRTKILSILKIKGPALPVHIARESGISMLFAGAFLSELAREDAIKISKTKVGGSPLYYLKGQENLLDNFYKYLPEKEREAFLMLQKEKILEDKKQHPAIRVALRCIKDFAVPFLKDGEIVWRFHTTSESEVRGILEPKAEVKEVKQPLKEEVKQEIKKITTERKDKQLDIGLKPIKKGKFQKKKVESFQNPLVIEETKKEKPKPEFIIHITEKINRKYKIIEEKNYAPREYKCIVQINSELGPINFLTFAKDKKKISETDIKKALSEAQKIPLPTLFLHNGELSKRAQEYARKYFSVLKVEKI